jgi:hypothetical protein
MVTTTKSRRVAVAGLCALLMAGGVVAACSNNSNPTPAPVYTLEGGADSTAPTDSGSGADTQPGQDGSAQDSGLLDGELLPDQDAAACTTDAGCWSCIPVDAGQFLNQCTSSQCSPFVNTQRLPDYDGSLPPLN